MRNLIWALAATLALLPGCAFSSGAGDEPAVITDPTPASRAQLLQAVQRALHSDPVMLAPDALTLDDQLSIDRVLRRDAQGRPLNGLDLGGRPRLFRLVKNGNDCILIHMDARMLRQRLSATTCRSRQKKNQALR